MKKFCTVCGNQMIVKGEREGTTFDRETGKPIVTKHTLLRCPDFVDGVSDRYWHTHDELEIDEVISGK